MTDKVFKLTSNHHFYISSYQNQYSRMIFGLISYQQQLQDLLFNYTEQILVKHTTVNSHLLTFYQIHSMIQEKSKQIEQRLKLNKLGTRSQRVWLWIQFLTQRQNLTMHLHALAEFIRLFKESKSIIELPIFHRQNHTQINIEYSPYLFRMKIKNSIGYLYINENFISAPIGTMKDLLLSAFNRNRKALQRIRAYSLSDDFLSLDRIISGQSTNLQNNQWGKNGI